MSAIDKIRSVKELTREVLVDHPRARDNHRYCVLLVWLRQKNGLMEMQFKDFANMYYSGDTFSNYESIDRARRRLQEKEPALRGVTWTARYIEEVEVRDNIKNL
jgi:hypothetical protein